MINDYVHSPCIRQCALDDDNICVGCFRTLEEIKRWDITTSEDRKTIVQNADGRKTTKENAKLDEPNNITRYLKKLGI